jgi:FkbM family methyltransferase
MKLTRNGIAVLEHDTHISRWVEEHNSLIHNKSLERELKYYIRPTDHILEIGAYIGDNTAILRNLVGSEGKVYSYEPNPMAFECLDYNFKDSNIVSCYNVGFGKEKGSAKVILNDNVGASYLEPNGDIEITTIDSLGLQKYKDRLDFIVIDAEGWELDILQGGVETLKTFKPTMLIEINRGTLEKFGKTPQDIFDFLKEIGYFCKNIFKNEPMEGEQFDILCY